MILSSIFSDSAWQLRHSWQAGPNRNELAKVLQELRPELAKNLSKELAAKVYSVCDELLQNSREHGCFGIGALKKAQLLQEGRFEEYLSNCDHSALSPNEHWIKLVVEISASAVLVQVIDSGPGYDLNQLPNEKSLDLARLSQRGLQIIENLSSSFVTESNPTRTTALFNLS